MDLFCNHPARASDNRIAAQALLHEADILMVQVAAHERSCVHQGKVALHYAERWRDTPFACDVHLLEEAKRFLAFAEQHHAKAHVMRLKAEALRRVADYLSPAFIIRTPFGDMDTRVGVIEHSSPVPDGWTYDPAEGWHPPASEAEPAPTAPEAPEPPSVIARKADDGTPVIEPADPGDDGCGRQDQWRDPTVRPADGGSACADGAQPAGQVHDRRGRRCPWPRA
jgi:hypothetical protein